MRLQAQIDRQIHEYDRQRPRKKFVGARAEDRFKDYEEEWRRKVERAGRDNFPVDERGSIYGSLRLTVSIRSDGSLQSIDLDRSSGNKALDRAEFAIVRQASPFPPFPPDIAKDYDLLVITRTWFFGRSNEVRAE